MEKSRRNYRTTRLVNTNLKIAQVILHLKLSE